MPNLIHRCGICGRRVKSAKGVQLHIRHTPACQRIWERQFARTAQAIAASQNNAAAESAAANSEGSNPLHGIAVPRPDSNEPIDVHEQLPEAPQRAHVEDVPEDEEDARRYVEAYPGVVADIIREDDTLFEQWRNERMKAGVDEWAPFEDQEEWELCRWLTKNVGQNKINEFLKLSIIRRDCNLSADNKYKFFKNIDDLPTGAAWKCDMINVRGDRIGDRGEHLQEDLELWWRDPVECTRELIGNPTFDGKVAYGPERVYTDDAGTIRRYDEMWTAEWWWLTQGQLPPGATIAPIILASDATKLTNFGGDKKAWPVYLSIGNISKSVRRQPSQRAMVLVGYIPVSKLECFQESTRSLAGYRLFHHCMTRILEPLRQAGLDGVEMTCADRAVRRVHPILAAYIADHPEQCLVCCCKENSCPRCTVPPLLRGEQRLCPPRHVGETLQALQDHKGGQDSARFTAEQLRPVYEPFWASLPHCDIFSSIMPDILHQLHKGMFKDHLLSWCTSIAGADEIDRRFRAMTDFPGLRRFRNGISHISQWTGREHREMQRVLVGLLAGAVPSEVLTVARALIDFIYYAQLQSHDDKSLAHLQASLDTFHRHKDIIVTLGIREHFNFPKLHSLLHYVEAIRSRGTCDGYNTELPERLHIELAKDAYRASNHRDYTQQMVTWLTRQEAVDLHASYITWLQSLEDSDGDAASSVDDEASELEDAPSHGDANADDAQDHPAANFTADSPNRQPHSYTIAKHCPFPNSSVHCLKTEFKATEFLPAFTEFIRAEYPLCRLEPNDMDLFDVYRNVSVTYPADPHGDTSSFTDRIRTVPTKPASGRKQTKGARFDTAYIIDPDLPAGVRQDNARSVAGKNTYRRGG
ncbi:hypothetical protein EVJ58_g9391 [Rhodofomes roseus]|uniref:C2H2-type domain-containing protein n=1 Tax=Rhodofomes roseus TaxID=34475 RepID=A0A4Y9XUX5_9APHY|nr:hypothetical protein EVJ58_g9391 [Rhodofomes roseus]